MSETAAAPAVDGWFTTGPEPALIGTRCRACGTVSFPRSSFACRNPDCDGEEFDDAPLSRRGRIWSYTDARYQPPPPYRPRTDPFQPFAIAAVELEAERMVVLGQVADGYGVSDLRIGQEVELVVEPLYVDETGEKLVWRWRPMEAGR